MTAPLLLEALRERGARVSVVERDGLPVLLVAPRGIVGDLAGEVARFKPSLVELLQAEQLLLDGADEAALELLRILRNAGVSIQLRDVAHAGDETGEVAADGSLLVWRFPNEWPDNLKRETTARLESEGKDIAARLKFERWHGRACAEHFGEDGKRLTSAPASIPYADYKQFARFQVGTQTKSDLYGLARFILAARHECAPSVFYGRVKIVWAVVAALSDREPTLGDVARWATLVLGDELA